MRRTVALSGWGQPHDALSGLAPEAVHLDYAQAASVEEALDMIAAAQPERAIGWSLGGQLLVRAIAEKRIAPRSLVLVAASYQFVESPELTLGMKRDTYRKFRDNYARNPARTLAKGWELVALGDAKAEDIRRQMRGREKMLETDWLSWLDRLAGFSCKALDLSRFPRTLLVHGKSDAVADYVQSEALAAAIPGSVLELWAGCGHAPHWHDAARLRALMETHHV